MAGKFSHTWQRSVTQSITLSEREWEYVQSIRESQGCNRSKALSYALKHAPHAMRYWEALDAIVPELGTLRLFVSAIKPADKDTQDKQDRLIRHIDRITSFAREERDGEGEAA